MKKTSLGMFLCLFLLTTSMVPASASASSIRQLSTSLTTDSSSFSDNTPTDILNEMSGNISYYFNTNSVNEINIPGKDIPKSVPPPAPGWDIVREPSHILGDIDFVNSTTGWAAGSGGTIIHTLDGGSTWSPQNSNTTVNLWGVCAVDASNCWAAGSAGTILRTSDGGTTWVAQVSGTYYDLCSIKFIDINNGWAVGMGGKILHTSDGGTTWVSQLSNTNDYLMGVSFIDNNNGWAAGLNGTILHTADGGDTWNSQNITSNMFRDIFFIDSMNGWAVGRGIFYTSDGGITWNVLNEAVYCNGVYVIDSDNGWVAGQNGSIRHTTNGGTTSEYQTSNTDRHLLSLEFIDLNNGWAAGEGMTVVHTVDGGMNWVVQNTNPSPSYMLRAVDFVSPYTGWTSISGRNCGPYFTGTSNKILYTNDDGNTWTERDTGLSHFGNCMDFTGSSGWTGGFGGSSIHTSDSGTTWVNQTTNTSSNLNGMSFINENTGWAAGSYGSDGGVIIHTSDGGNTWLKQASNTSLYHNAIQFIDTNNGWVVGGYGSILRTSNGGVTWVEQISGTTSWLYGVCFIDSNNGWTVGDDGTILHTSNGGTTWIPQTSNVFNTLNSVKFVDANNGWTAGNDGIILYTSDGGNNWTPQYSGTRLNLRSITAVNNTGAWAVGDYGVILKYSAEIVPELISITVTPNPVTSAAGLTQQFTASGHYSDSSFVDITGQVYWTSSNPNAAIVKAGGLAYSYNAGTTTITATSGGVSGTAVYDVTAAVLDVITVTPENPVIAGISGMAATQQFTATGVNTNGSILNLTNSATWSSSNPAVATIDPAAGTATIVGYGTTVIGASSSGKTGNTVLTVFPDTTPPIVKVSSPSQGMILNNSTLTVKGNAGDAAAATVIVNGVPIALVLDVNRNFNQNVTLKTGRNNISVSATDAAGNKGSSGTIDVDVKPGAPAIVITSPDEGFVTAAGTATVTGTVSGVGSTAKLRVNGVQVGSIVNGAFSIIVGLNEGVNVIVVSGYDPAGIIIGTSGIRTVVRDTTPPAVTIVSPAPGGIVNTPGANVAGTIDDPGVTQATLNLNGIPQAIPVSDGKFSQNIALVAGVNTITVTAADLPGNTSPAAIVTLIYDNVKPQVKIITPVNKKVTNQGSQLVTGSVNDLSVTSAALFVNGVMQAVTVAPDGSFSKMVALAGGVNTIEARATDVAGNTGTSGIINVTLDVKPPYLAVSLTDPTDTMVITVISSEALATAPVLGGGAAGVVLTQTKATEWTGVLSPVPPGDQVLTVTGTDKAANTGTAFATFVQEVIASITAEVPTIVGTDTVILEITTAATLTGQSISVTQHDGNPADNDPMSSGSAGIFLEIVASGEIVDNLEFIQIEVSYDEGEIFALGLDEATLKLYVFNPIAGQWEVVPGSASNVSGNYVYGAVTHLSKFGIFGSSLMPEPIPVPSPVTTANATGVTDTEATLHGRLEIMEGIETANVSFLWGTTSNITDHETTSQAMSSTGNFSAVLTGLTENTTYYYRAKAVIGTLAGNFTVFGEELSFTTLSQNTIENFTTYTEVDPESRVSVSSNEVTFSDVNFRGSDTYVYQDKGENYFDGDFEHTFTAGITSMDRYALPVMWMLSNTIDDRKGIMNANQDYLSFEMYTGDNDIFYIRIQEFTNGLLYEDHWTGGSVGTTYYLKVIRDEGIGEYSRLYAYIYADPGRIILLDTLQLDLHDKIDFRYIYALNTSNDPQEFRATGFVRDMYLQEDLHTYTSYDYFNTGEGLGIKYHVTDSYNSLDVNAWAVSQYYESGKPHELNFLFTLTKEGSEGLYFRNSALSGSYNLTENKLTCFFGGFPSGNQANFYRNLCIPDCFVSGDNWSLSTRTYSIESIGSQNINGFIFNDCIRLTVDDSQNTNDYLKGSGYFILARNIGIVKLVFNRMDGTSVLFEYLDHRQLTRQSLSGTVTDGSEPVNGGCVQIANADWGTRSVTDINGTFSIQAYGPDVVVRAGYDLNNDHVLDFDIQGLPVEYTVNNITSNVTDLVIEIPPLTTSPDPGDANGDGIVNVLDMTKTARIILQMDAGTPGADANQDGIVNVLDITRIAIIILNIDTFEVVPSEIQWQKTFGGGLTDSVLSVKQTPDGGYITAGAVESFGAGSYDSWLIKTDTNGNEIWSKTFGGESRERASSIDLTLEGGYIIGAETNSFGAGLTDGWLIKTDINGNKIWDYTFGGASDDFFRSVQTTSDGGYIITGATKSSGAGGYDVWLVKTDSSGNVSWRKTFGGMSDDSGSSVLQTNDGGYIVVGNTYSYGTGSSDFYIIKTNASGNLTWSTQFGGTGRDEAYSVKQTTDGGYIITGGTNITDIISGDVYLIKTDVNGNMTWSNTFGGSAFDVGNSVCQTLDGGYIIVGNTYLSAGGDSDLFIIKTDLSGNIAWSEKSGGAEGDEGYTIESTLDGGYVISGATASSGAGYHDGWLIKLAPSLTASLKTPGNLTKISPDNNPLPAFKWDASANATSYEVKIDSGNWINVGNNLTYVQPVVLDKGSHTVSVIAKGSGGTISIAAILGFSVSVDANLANTKIAFMTDRDGNSEIYTMNIDGTGQTRLTNNSTYEDAPSWSPDGSRIAFRRDVNDFEVYVMNADGSEQSRLTAGQGLNIEPVWSPDGNRIIFTSARDGAGWQLFVMNNDGTVQTRLIPNNGGADRGASLSPDGTKIVFNRADYWGNGNQIYMMNSDGSEQTQLTSLGINGSPAWSPDGSKIVFVSTRDGSYADGKRDIYVMDSDGSNQIRLTMYSSVVGDPVWSPDGMKIVFLYHRDGNTEFYIMNADGTEQTRLFTNTSNDEQLAWSPFQADSES